MDVEQWQLIEGASARADKGLETIERCLDNFEEAMLIACTMMMWDLLPIGQRLFYRSMAQREVLLTA